MLVSIGEIEKNIIFFMKMEKYDSNNYNLAVNLVDDLNLPFYGDPSMINSQLGIILTIRTNVYKRVPVINKTYLILYQDDWKIYEFKEEKTFKTLLPDFSDCKIIHRLNSFVNEENNKFLMDKLSSICPNISYILIRPKEYPVNYNFEAFTSLNSIIIDKSYLEYDDDDEEINFILPDPKNALCNMCGNPAVKWLSKDPGKIIDFTNWTSSDFDNYTPEVYYDAVCEECYSNPKYNPILVGFNYVNINETSQEKYIRETIDCSIIPSIKDTIITPKDPFKFNEN